MQKDKRVDEYIAAAKPFARPILERLRRLVHAAAPQIQETIKWGMPYFEYKGIVCHMAAFNHHCAFGFWKASLMKDADMLIANNGKAMGHAGKITDADDLPPDKVLMERVREAVRLNEEEVPLPPTSKKHTLPELPEELLHKLSRNKSVAKKFNALPSSHQREYVDWLLEARKPETREKRIKSILEWVNENSKGKRK